MNKSAIIYFFLACFTVIIGNSGTSTAQINNSAEFETAKTRFAQGFVYFNEMKYLSASELFRQALYIYPEYHVSREYLARSYKMSGYFEESLTEWELLYKSAENPSVKNKIDNIRFFEAEISPPVSEEYLLKRKIISKEMNRFKFPYPSDMTIDSEKNIYISSFSSGKIVKLNSLFEGIDTKQFSTNSGIYGLAYNIDKNLIAATDFKNDKIYILNTDMKIIKEFGSSGSAPGQLHGPEGIAFNNKDYLYVADTGNSRIQKFSLNGDFIAEYGKKGKYNEMFSNPTSVTVYDNNVYVTDTDNSRVAIYDDYGNFLKNLKSEFIVSPRGITGNNGRIFISDDKNGVIIYNIAEGTFKQFNSWNENEYFSRTYASAFDRDGFFYVLDHNYETIYNFTTAQRQYTNIDIEIVSVDTSKFPVVAFYLNIRDRSGKSIYGIKGQNVAVFEDNAKMGNIYINYLKDQKKNLSIVLCNDKSLGLKNNQKDLSWAADFILKKMNKNDRIKIINFNNDYWTANDFDWSRLRSLKAMDEDNYSGGKNIGKALYNSITDLIAKDNRRAVILLTDGKLDEDSFAQYSEKKITNYARVHNIPIYIITLQEKNDVLKDIAQKTGGNIYGAYEMDSLNKIYDAVLNSEEYRYTAIYSTFKNKSFRGWWSDVSIKVDINGQTGVEWGGYFVP